MPRDDCPDPRLEHLYGQRAEVNAAICGIEILIAIEACLKDAEDGAPVDQVLEEIHRLSSEEAIERG